jgi:hypothetical protein
MNKSESDYWKEQKIQLHVNLQRKKFTFDSRDFLSTLNNISLHSFNLPQNKIQPHPLGVGINIQAHLSARH